MKSIIPIGIVVALVCLGCVHASTQHSARVLHFPQNRSLGELTTQDAGNIDTPVRHWKSLGEAKGEVTVPAGHLVMLHVSKDGWKDLSPLANLRPDDLYGFKMNWHTAKGCDYNDQLVHLSHLRNIKCLALHFPQLTASHLSHLQKLKHLESLTVSPIMSNENILRQISTFRNIKELQLHFSQDRLDLRHLTKLRKLENLGFFDVLVTDGMMADLASLPNLKSLSIEGSMHWMMGGGNALTDKGLSHISKITSLESLHLDTGRYTDKGLEHLSEMKNLRRLSLTNHPLSAAGKKHLDRLQEEHAHKHKAARQPNVEP